MIQNTRVLLLVEDNPGDAELVTELLAGDAPTAFKVVHVSALRKAVALVQDHQPDVILLDLGLPDGNGIEVVTALRDAAPEVPIVVLTGTEDEALALTCLEAGAQDYLAKGQIEARALKRAIGYAVSRVREAQLRELQGTLVRYRSLAAQGAATSVTAALAGTGAVSLRNPAGFNSIVANYYQMLEPYLLRVTDKVSAPRAAKEMIITTLGDANGGPRDLLEVHVAAIDQALSLYTDAHSRTIVFEARLLALEMMGLLVDYYRVGLRRRYPEGPSP